MESHPCPNCSKVFDTQRGLGVHHVHVHDTRLPNRECDFCGMEFYSDTAKKYCSRECLDNSDSYAGVNNPNYRGGKEVSACDICGDKFEYYPSEKPGLYCSECVKNEQWRETPDPMTGQANNLWSGGKVQLTCPVCDSSFERFPSSVTDGVNLCSDECRAAWLSEAFAGENHPNWKGGGNENYGTGWAETRRKALARDGYQCVVCGTTKEALGRNPDVHHIVPVRRFTEAEEYEKEDAHRLDNVVSLCIDCHRKADFGKISKADLRSLIQDESPG